jgi:hypothetical protein
MMWVPGSLVYLVPVGLLVMQLLNAPRTHRQDTTHHTPSIIG